MAHRRGDGTLFKRGRIYYYAYFESGKQIQRSTKTDRFDEAKKWRDRYLGKKLRGEVNSAVDRVSCGQLLDDLLAHSRTRCREYTVKVWEWTINANVRPAFGHLKAASLTSDQFKAYREKRLADGKSNTTVNRELALLRMALNLGRKQTPPKVHIVPYFPMAKEDNARQGFMEDGEYAALRDALEDVGLRALFVTAYHTGMRRGELLAIRVEQVDLEQGFITLRAAETKGGKARVVPIFEGDMKTLIAAAIAESQDGYLFTRKGRRILNFKGAWKAATDAAKLPGFLFHSLRRTAVRNLRRAGVSQIVRMAISGHRTTSMEQRYNICDTDDLEVAKTLMAKKKE